MARSSLAGLLACALSLLASAPCAQPVPHEYAFDIGQVPITIAIKEFAGTTGLQIGFLPNNSSEERTIVGPLKGRYTADAALTKLLKSSGLRFSWINERTVSIESAPAANPPKRTAKNRSSSARARQRKQSAAAERAFPNIVPDVIVIAERYRSIADRDAPVLIFERSAIVELGAATLSDLIYKHVPQQVYMRPEGFRASGAQYAELRGLGTDTTLILINGRRTVPTASNGTSNAFDLNTIPLPAVERVEVLPDSGSAAYGADAIGGVINVVLRRDIPQPAMDLHYGVADGGADQRRISLSGGYADERAHGALVLDYFEVGGLVGAERALWRDQDFRRFGGADQRSLNSSPGNITSLTADNLPGLPSPFAAVPAANAGASVEDFLATAGQRNVESLYKYLSVVPEGKRLSAAGVLELELTANLAASTELLYVNRSTDFQFSPPVLPGVAVPETNAFNPFGTPVLVNALLSGIDPQNQNVEATLLRAAIALRGRWSSWGGELSVLNTQEDASTWIDNALDPVRLADALAQPDPDRALNVFQNGPGGSPELLAELVADPRTERLASGGRQAAAILGGPLFELPAGSLSAVLGGEWRKEVAQFDATLGSFDRNVLAAFAELRIPLLGAFKKLPAVEELTLTIAGRFDDYSDFGHIFNPQYGLTWRPYGGLAVHASYMRSFRPASLYELFLPKVSIPTQLPDPQRNGELASVMLTTGGNRDLTATTGDVFTAGFTFTPAAVADLEISASYWRVNMADRITSIPLTSLLASETSFSDRVIRAEPTPADLAAGWPGRLRALDISRVNFGQLETSGIDIGAAYDFDTPIGRLTPSVSATWVDQFETVDPPGFPAIDRVNVANELGTIVRWRAAGSIGWKRGAASAFAAVRYTPSYADAAGGVRTGRVIPSQAIIDMQASFDLSDLAAGDSSWRGMRLTLGAANLSDELPHFAQVNSATGFDFSQGDLKGRFCYVRLGKTF